MSGNFNRTGPWQPYMSSKHIDMVIMLSLWRLNALPNYHPQQSDIFVTLSRVEMDMCLRKTYIVARHVDIMSIGTRWKMRANHARSVKLVRSSRRSVVVYWSDVGLTLRSQGSILITIPNLQFKFDGDMFSIILNIYLKRRHRPWQHLQFVDNCEICPYLYCSIASNYFKRSASS